MGGRGGSPNATTQAPRSNQPAAPVSLAIDPAREYRQWLNNPRDIAADSLGGSMGSREEKVNMLLPDRDATLQWNGKSFIVRDMQTDEQLPFKGQRHSTVYGQIARYYGRRVEYIDNEGRARHFGKNLTDLSKTPAARKYGIR